MYQATDEAAIASVIDCLCNHPRHREILYKTIVFCEQERTENETLDFIEQQPEYASALQESFTMLAALEKRGAVTLRDFDSESKLMDNAYRQNLRDSGLDDDAIAARRAYSTVRSSAAGLAGAHLFSPHARMLACMRTTPPRKDALLSLLGFCETPRTLAEINDLLQSHPALSAPEEDERAPQASYFIDRLAEAGGIVWDKAWLTTNEGHAFLAADQCENTH